MKWSLKKWSLKKWNQLRSWSRQWRSRGMLSVAFSNAFVGGLVRKKGHHTNHLCHLRAFVFWLKWTRNWVLCFFFFCELSPVELSSVSAFLVSVSVKHYDVEFWLLWLVNQVTISWDNLKGERPRGGRLRARDEIERTKAGIVWWVAGATESAWREDSGIDVPYHFLPAMFRRYLFCSTEERSRKGISDKLPNLAVKPCSA